MIDDISGARLGSHVGLGRYPNVKINQKDRELFSSNRGISHLNEACRINDLIRGSIWGYEILTNN